LVNVVIVGVVVWFFVGVFERVVVEIMVGVVVVVAVGFLFFGFVDGFDGGLSVVDVFDVLDVVDGCDRRRGESVFWLGLTCGLLRFTGVFL
jgi:hypothetical protein